MFTTGTRERAYFLLVTRQTPGSREENLTRVGQIMSFLTYGWYRSAGRGVYVVHVYPTGHRVETCADHANHPKSEYKPDTRSV